jgi:HEAT repeat protein
MRCQTIKEKFPDFLIGDLDQKTKEDIQAHLSTCPFCREELENLSSMWTKLGVLPEEHPSQSLHTQFYSMLESYKQELEQQKSKHTLRKIMEGWFTRWWPRRPALQFSLVLLVLIIGLAAGYFLNTTRRTANDLAQLRQEVQSMHQMLAVSLLDQSSPSDRIKGINLSYGIKSPEPDILQKLLYILDNDPNVNVRLSAVDALYLYHSQPIVREGLAQSLSKQTSPLVQVALIDLIVQMRERQAVEALKRLIQEEELQPEVRNRAEQSIQQLSF